MNFRQFLLYCDRLGIRRRWALTILFLQLVSVLFEGIGIGMFLPILEYMNGDGDVARMAAESGLWKGLVTLFAALDVPVNLGTLLAAAFLGIVFRQIFVYLRLVYTAHVQIDAGRHIRDQVFQRFLHADLGYLDRARTGDIVNDIFAELMRAIGCFNAAVSFAGYVLLCLVYVGFLLALSVTMTLVAVGAILLSAWSLRGLLKRTHEIGTALTEANTQMSRFLLERLKTVRLIRLSATEGAESETMRALTRSQRDKAVSVLKLKAKISVLIEPVVIGIALAMLYFAVSVFGLGIERILLFFLILVRILPVIKEAMLARQGVLSTIAGLAAIDRRLSELHEVREMGGGRRPFRDLERSIRFRDVSFDYVGPAGSAPALIGIDLEIPAGRMTALVGPSGAGKSTLIDLLPRLRRPQSGEILFDDVPLADFDLASLRAGIAFAPQSPLIFNVSVAENIRYGRREASDEEIHAAARLALAHDFIEELPQGYDTVVGEHGALLSGGQRQRLELARTLVRQSSILILDEPTSNLDAEAQHAFRQTLDHIRRETEMTLIVVGHQLYTAATADLIVVLDRGRLAAQGTHAELMRQGGWYASALARHEADAPRDSQLAADARP